MTDYAETVRTAPPETLRVMVAERLGWCWRWYWEYICSDLSLAFKYEDTTYRMMLVPPQVMDEYDAEPDSKCTIDYEKREVHPMCPNWPGDIGQAWELWRELAISGEWVFEFECDSQGCSALFLHPDHMIGRAEGGPDDEAATICRAWLLAMGEGEDA